ncbi:Uncharacterized protein APZ42_000200, partial [Daphnia magna]
ASSEDSDVEDEEELQSENLGNKDDTEEDLDFVAITNLLAMPEEHEDEALEMETYSLPKQRRCACHTLNLVATQDPGGIKDRSFVKLYGSLEGKMQGIWNKQARSTKASDFIKETLGGLFVLPNET